MVPIVYRYSVSKIYRLKKTLEDYLAEFVGSTPRGPEFERLVRIVRETLPGTTDWRTLEDSLRHLAGTPVTAELAKEAAWRMAGNVRRLRQRRPVPPWHVQRLPEWVPLRVISARHSRDRYGRLGALFSFRVEAGTPCPRVVWKWWSVKQCRFFAKDFGFSRSRGPDSVHAPKYPYSHPAQFVLLRLYGRVDPDLCDREPQVGVFAWPPPVRAYNREQLKKRFRVDPGYACPEGYHATFPCHQCVKGYASCPAATHRLDWVRRACPKCGRKDALFDPEVPSETCVDCAVEAVYRGDK